MCLSPSAGRHDLTGSRAAGQGCLSHAPSHGTLWGTTYHQQVVKEEDFSLVQSEFLGLIWVWNLEEPAVADQSPVGQREHLCGVGSTAVSPLPLC